MKTIIVTGASSGIGKAIADYILGSTNDTQVILTARTAKPLQDFQNKYSSDRVQFIVGDLAQEGFAKKIVEFSIEKYKGIDSIIANAGVLGPVGSVKQINNIKEWKKCFDVNVFANIELVSNALPYLTKSHGNIIFVSSGASSKPYEGWAAYGSSKAVINHYALSVSSEIKEIKAISLAPGVVDTKMQDEIRSVHKDSMGEGIKRFFDLKKNKLLLDPDYIAKIYGNLAIKGIPENLNGQYVRYNDEKLKDFA